MFGDLSAIVGSSIDSQFQSLGVNNRPLTYGDHVMFTPNPHVKHNGPEDHPEWGKSPFGSTSTYDVWEVRIPKDVLSTAIATGAESHPDELGLTVQEALSHRQVSPNSLPYYLHRPETSTRLPLRFILHQDLGERWLLTLVTAGSQESIPG